MSEKAKVEKRLVLGKGVKKLRKDGILPANLYGKDIASVAIQLPMKDFEELFEKVGETGIVDVTLDGKSTPALVHDVHIHPLTKTPLHADFLKINLKEKITANIPLEFVGESEAVKGGLGSFMRPISEIEVEALPTELPEKIEVNIERLAAVGDQILVKDIKAPQGVEIKNEENDVIAMIAEIKEEVEPEPEAETTEAETTEEGKEEAGESNEQEAEKQESSEEPKQE